MGNDMAYSPDQVEAMISAAIRAAMAATPPQQAQAVTPPQATQQITLSSGETYNVSGGSIAEIVESILEQREKKKRDTPLFRDYAKQWRELYHDPRIGDRWRLETTRMMEHHILPFFGDTRIGDIDVAMIQRFFNNLSDRSESTNKHIKHMIGGILQSAVEDELIDKNPARSTRLTLSKKKTPRKALELDEARDILINMCKLPREDQLLLALLMNTGMRRGEAIALRWQDIDLEARMIHITHAITFADGNHPVIKDPKSRAGIRDIPISDMLYPHLEGGGDPDVFLLSGTTEPLTAHTYAWQFNRIR